MNQTPAKVLIVEDEPAVSLALRDTLLQEGFEVETAGDGAKGLEAALAHHPDVIITDLKMPGMDGLAMIDELRKDSWGTTAKIIILSNASDLETLQAAMEHATFHYMVKGDSSVEDIVTAIKKQLEH